MISFPIFSELGVHNFGLYPGTSERPGVNIKFKPGLTLILGANGLGKTTLVTLLYRMLAGTSELPKATLEAKELGGASLDAKPLGSNERALFANRVNDLAENAEAVLKLSMGGKALTIRRNLKDLSLVAFHVGGDVVHTDEAEFQALMPTLAGVPTFGDWLLLLRQMIFYFEDRRELVWDASAQRHVFRTMFLGPEEAAAWYRREREIFALDSRYRNDTAALNRLRKRVQSIEKAQGDRSALSVELGALLPLQEQDTATLNSLVTEADELDSRRHDLRKELLVAEMEADKASRSLEAEKLALLQHRFPTPMRSSQHLYSLLIVNKECMVCGQTAGKAAEELAARILDSECVVCGNQLPALHEGENVASFSIESARRLHAKQLSEQVRVASLRAALEECARSYDDVATRMIDLRDAIDKRQIRIRRIEAALGPGDETKEKAKSDLTTLESELAQDRARLQKLGEAFKTQIEQANASILKKTQAIKTAFHAYASGFLAEDVQLKWSPVEQGVGQLEIAKVKFPAFRLEMSGSDFGRAIPRNGPEAVSESQREFIDLAFRMALIEVAGESQGGSLVIDAPESSLDAFFVKRAANVLTRFGGSDSKNRLVVASNLVVGDLLPEMIRGGIPASEQHDRLINLMDIAVPTAALRDNRAQYKDALRKIQASGGLGD